MLRAEKYIIIPFKLKMFTFIFFVFQICLALKVSLAGLCLQRTSHYLLITVSHNTGGKMAQSEPRNAGSFFFTNGTKDWLKMSQD